ncbi:hypothetical protein L2E82_18365 [Cichorium intybus]|uniref:Uncharacterized protein n=1 Tax=Cichorium intybus TaxID=13427 RepID=A0ACB9FB87_CICIN|nr:hypothetical protein L2E82_18365 [Cichorium intybus]
MIGRRISSRRRNNVQSRFSNNPENPVTIDGDEDELDDFVDPLKGIPSTTVSNKGDNIKEQTNVIDVSSSKQKKEKVKVAKMKMVSRKKKKKKKIVEDEEESDKDIDDTGRKLKKE